MQAKGNNPAPVSFQTILEQVQPSRLCRHDPVGNLFLKAFPRSVWHVGAFAFMLYGLLMFGGGSLLSIMYEERGARFISLFDSRDWPIAILAHLIVSPAIWSFYAWQPRGISKYLHKLYKNGVIGQPRREHGQIVSILRNSWNRKFFWISLIIVILGMILWLFYIVLLNYDPLSFGGNRQWWIINDFYFWTVWIPFNFINLYMMAWIIFRQIIATIIFNHIFKEFWIRPKILHPDGCNGLSPIGDYAMQSSSIAVLLGFWLSVIIVYPVLFGYQINIKGDTILMMFVYIVAVPSLLLSPVMRAHKSMVEFKNRFLNELSEQIQSLLTETNPETALFSKDLLLELERRYELARKKYRTWPFRPWRIKGFSISAMLPLFSTAISYLSSLYTK